MRRLALALSLPPLLALAGGCSDGAGETGQAAPDAAATEVKLSVDLNADGISVPPQGAQEQMAVPFGSEREATENTLSAALGSIKSRDQSVECPAGPMSFTDYEGIKLAFQKGKFVGWFASGGDYLPDFDRAALEASDPTFARVEGSTLGEEYTLGTEAGPMISLTFASAAANAPIEAMWAGTNCIFR